MTGARSASLSTARPARASTVVFRTSVVVLAAFVAAAVFAGQLAPYPPNAVTGAESLLGPSRQHLLGTDSIGRDVLSRLIFGTRVSLGVAAPSVLISLVCGLLVGLLCAYFGGALDQIVMRVIDVLFAFPAVLLAIALVAVLGTSLQNLVIVIGIIFAPRFTVTVRGAAQSVRQRNYVVASKIMGGGWRWIASRHLLPNIAPVVVVETALCMSAAILTDAALSFVGLGAQPPTASWGGMLQDAQASMVIAPWTAIAPGVAIVIVVIALNVLADGLRDRLEVRRP